MFSAACSFLFLQMILAWQMQGENNQHFFWISVNNSYITLVILISLYCCLKIHITGSYSQWCQKILAISLLQKKPTLVIFLHSSSIFLSLDCSILKKKKNLKLIILSFHYFLFFQLLFIRLPNTNLVYLTKLLAYLPFEDYSKLFSLSFEHKPFLIPGL